MDSISDSDSEDAGSIPAGATKQSECGERERPDSLCFYFALTLTLTLTLTLAHSHFLY